MKKIRVDYHFHPNLPTHWPIFKRYLCNIKARAIWKAFEKNNLDVVLVADHVYRNPKTQFEILRSQKPKNAKTIIIPAIEYLTMEGVEIIVFAKYPQYIYSKKELLEPYSLEIKEFISYVKRDKKLHGIVVHPETPGTTGISKCGKETMEFAIKELGFLEVHNCALDMLEKLVRKLGLHKILKKKYAQILKTQNASHLLKDGVVPVIGSDAHHTWEIGDCMEIEADNRHDLDYLFKIITTQHGKLRSKKKPWLGLLVGAYTTSKEWFIKNAGLYTIDKPL